MVPHLKVLRQFRGTISGPDSGHEMVPRLHAQRPMLRTFSGADFASKATPFFRSLITVFCTTSGLGPGCGLAPSSQTLRSHVGHFLQEIKWNNSAAWRTSAPQHSQNLASRGHRASAPSGTPSHKHGAGVALSWRPEPKPIPKSNSNLQACIRRRVGMSAIRHVRVEGASLAGFSGGGGRRA